VSRSQARKKGSAVRSGADVENNRGSKTPCQLLTILIFSRNIDECGCGWHFLGHAGARRIASVLTRKQKRGNQKNAGTKPHGTGGISFLCSADLFFSLDVGAGFE
jgi:hypothetical protein